MEQRGPKYYTKPERVPTGVAFTTEQGEARTFRDETYYLVHYPIEEIPCPDCGEKSLKCGFDPGELCPHCKKGELIVTPIIY